MKLSFLKRVVPLLLVVLGVVVMSLGAVGAQDDDLTFAMVAHGGAGNPFWITVIKGMEDACELLDANCQWLADPVDNVNDMAGYWDDALALNPDGIGTTSPNPDVIRGGVETANEQGIPVIIFNTADPNAGTDEELDTLFYIGASEFTGGVSNGRRILAEAAADGAEITGVVCPIQEVGHSGLEARCSGVESVMDEAGIPVQRLTISNNPTESAAVIQDFFAANPDTNAITMLGPSPASAWALAAEEMGLEPRQVYATTHDTSAEIYEMIQDGYLLQAIDQQPYLQGFETVMWLYLNSQYELAPGGDIFTGPGVIDLGNVDAIIALTAEGYR
ncbi:MAG: substrate-binding domain-containing protein [Burkholderiales bacterium]|nr:substrate-binding domain-containing protein [Anaerolineae bacterium]